MTETVQPARLQPNPYLSRTADDEAWQLMSAPASQRPEPLRVWLSRNSLVRSAEDRGKCKGVTRERSRSSTTCWQPVCDTAVDECAVAAARTRSTLGLTSVAVALECLSVDR